MTTEPDKFEPFTPEQAEVRRGGLCASDIPQLVLHNPRFGGPHRVWRDKTGRLERDPDTVDSLYGHAFESGVRMLYEIRTGQQVSVPGTLVHPELPLVRATPDGLLAAKTLQIKCPRHKDDWGEDGTQDIPTEYWPQITWEMAAAGKRRCDMAIPDEYARTIRIYPDLVFDEDLFREMYEYCAAWWERHVVRDVPPPVDATKDVTEWLRRRHPRAGGTMLEDDSAETARLVRQYAEATEAEKRATAAKAAARNALMARIGDHRGLVGSWGKVTYANVSNRLVTDWEAIARSLDPPEQVIQQHTAVRPGHRRFDARIAKGAA